MPVKIGKQLGSKQQQNASNGTKADNSLKASNIRGEVGGIKKSIRGETSTVLVPFVEEKSPVCVTSSEQIFASYSLQDNYEQQVVYTSLRHIHQNYK
jgi:hypothetical protein